MTKLVTTIASLQLVEQGKIELDTPIDSYVPELNALQVLKGFGSGNIPDYEKAYRAPTTRELMTHTAGYVYEIWNRNAQKAVSWGSSRARSAMEAFWQIPWPFNLVQHGNMASAPTY